MYWIGPQDTYRGIGSQAGDKKKAGQARLAATGKMFHGLGKGRDGGVGIPVFDAVAHAVLDMALEDNLSYFMKCRFYRIDLRQDILARHILIHPYGRSPAPDR